MRLRRHSRNWIPSRNSGRQPSWVNSWRPGFHNRFTNSAVPAGPLLLRSHRSFQLAHNVRNYVAVADCPRIVRKAPLRAESRKLGPPR